VYHGFRFTVTGKVEVTAQTGQSRKLVEIFIKEECQPDTFSFSVLSDQVHSIVPVSTAHQRQTVCTE